MLVPPNATMFLLSSNFPSSSHHYDVNKLNKFHFGIPH